MTETGGVAPDSPETGDVDTTSMYGAGPDAADDASDDEVTALGDEEDLSSGSTGALPEG
jgi:hypothetical protein